MEDHSKSYVGENQNENKVMKFPKKKKKWKKINKKNCQSPINIKPKKNLIRVERGEVQFEFFWNDGRWTLWSVDIWTIGSK